MVTRRDCLTYAAGACATLALKPALLAAQEAAWSGDIIKRAIPATGEEIPIIGLGSSATFQRLADADDQAAIEAVLKAMLDNGGTVFDTAPSYGASERVAGAAIRALGAEDRIFWATKLNVAGFGGGTADPDAAWAQIENSYRYFSRSPIDLIQVHNIADMPTQFGILRELKDQGRARYIGVTSTFEQQYPALEEIMRNEPLDFVGIDYAVDNRGFMEDTLFPIARDRGIAVMVYLPFGRTRLWNRVEGHDVPAWAAEFGATTWAQFFLKFAASHPAVTVVTPATSNPSHMIDNMGSAYGRLPDEGERRRMVEYIDSLPG